MCMQRYWVCVLCNITHTLRFLRFRSVIKCHHVIINLHDASMQSIDIYLVLHLQKEQRFCQSAPFSNSVIRVSNWMAVMWSVDWGGGGCHRGKASYSSEMLGCGWVDYFGGSMCDLGKLGFCWRQHGVKTEGTELQDGVDSALIILFWWIQFLGVMCNVEWAETFYISYLQSFYWSSWFTHITPD